MYPALKDGDVVLYFRTHKIVNTEACVYRTDDGVKVGRVEATGGTVISATGDLQMTFDGNYLPISRADGIYSKTYALEGTRFPFEIKEGNYFILGDNRDEAVDSRKYGQINRKSVKGRIVTVLRRRQI
jgi:signal peptidase I